MRKRDRLRRAAQDGVAYAASVFFRWAPLSEEAQARLYQWCLRSRKARKAR